MAVQIIPFAYTFIYILVLFAYGNISDETASMLDTLFYISPIQIVGLLILSKILHLCKWHRMACVLPLFPLNTIVHEIIHIVQHIALEDGIDPFGEDFAYAGGDIASTVSDIVCVLSCPHCSGA